MAAAETALQKQCRIKTAVVQRIEKELQRYHEDLDAQKAKVSRMRSEAADEYDTRKQTEIQTETESMIPDSMRRLEKAVEDLQEFVEVNAIDLEGSSQLQAAQEVLSNRMTVSGLDIEDERI